MTALKSRKDNDSNYQWDLSHMIKDEAEWQTYFQQIEEMAQGLKAFSGRLAESPQVLHQCLSHQEALEEKFSRLYAFSNMRFHEDTAISEHQAATEKVGALQGVVGAAGAFIEPELLSMDSHELKQMIQGYKPLNQYDHYVDDLIRQKAHILPKEQEELLASLSDFADSPGNIFSMFNNTDIKFPDVIDEKGKPAPLTKGNFVKYLESDHVNVRRTAFKTLYEKYRESENTLAATLTANLKKDVFIMKTRGFDSTCQASLFGKNIDVAVYDNLIDAVHKNMGLMHRYVKLRKQMLEIDDLHMYDLYTPMVSDMKEEISYEEAKSTVLEALKVMGPEYVSVVEKAFEEKWIDVYENQGKRGGAYSWGVYGNHPHILLNWQDNLNNMFTLAHELGHTMHSHYSNTLQPYTYASYPIFLAEVASTVNESLLMQHLLKTTSDTKKRMYLLNHFMDSFKGTLYRQTMFAEFERMIHEEVEKGEALTAKTLCERYKDLNRQYYGEAIVVDEEIAMEWARIPHFYYNYYVYQYATGFSSAVAIASDILDRGQDAVDNYITNFLSAGKSKYPLETLKAVGVDMTTAEPVESALKVFEGILDEMEALAAK